MRSSFLHLFPSSLILILFCLINFISADPPITPKDRAALRRFRPEVDHFLPHDYMKEDWYLLRWIRTKKYDLEGAKELLEKNIEWRKENDMDNLEYDPKSAFANDFPIRWPGVDKEGRPVVITDHSGDIRKFVLAGKRKELIRHLISTWEIVDRKVRELNLYKNNSESIQIHDFNNFETRTHLCVQCLPVHVAGATILEYNYPLSGKEFIGINTPRIFQVVRRLIDPILGDTVKRLTFFGNDKEEWKRYLLKQIDADQLPVKYGGTQSE